MKHHMAMNNDSVDNFRFRFTYISLSVTYTLCILFLFVYIYLNTLTGIVFILTVSALYSVTVLLMKKHYSLAARIWFLSILMTHMAIVTFLFSSLSGFHYYLFVLPALTGIFFDMTKPLQRVLSGLYFILAIVIFLYFNHSDPVPYIVLKTGHFSMLKISSSIITMISLFVGFSFFGHEIKKSKENLIQIANTDSLTGISNRREFFITGRKEINRCLRYHSSLSLLLIDLDNFKKINDTYGHSIGDIVLKEFVQFTLNKIRAVDSIARFGGDEFCVLLPDSDNREAVNLAERLRSGIENFSIYTDSGDIQCTVSIGVSSLGKTNKKIENLLLEADKAMYRAKASGRNQVES